MIILAIVLFVLSLIVLGPVLVIWALNTLFGLTIAYTGWNLLAALVLLCLLKGPVKWTD